MNYKHIVVTEQYNGEEFVSLIELNRPKALNALCTPLMNELVDALLKLNDGKTCRCVILTGRGKAFAAGADIAEMEEDTPITKVMEERFRAWEQFSLVRIPILAAVNGYALGGGCELAMSCDLIIAAEEAKFGQPEINIGTIPGASGTQRLTKAVGKSKAMYHILTGEMFSAKEAYTWNLVARVVPREALMQESFIVAKKIAEKSPVSTRLAKEAVNKSFEMSLKDGIDFERKNFYITFASADQKEGMRAFLEKRKPCYRGE